MKEHSAASATDAETWREDEVARAVTDHDAHRQDSAPALVAFDGATHALTSEGADASEDGTGRGAPIVTALVEAKGGVAHALTTEGSRGGEDGTGRGAPIVAAPLTAGSHSPGLSPLGRRLEDDYNLVEGAAESCEVGATCWFDPLPDGHRYAACGDGVVSPVAHWIGLRLGAVIRGEDPNGAA